MKYLCTREEMQQIDAYSIEKIGIPGLVLMEKAAMAVRDEITNRFSSDSSVLIVVEKGNNGGDGLALGRLLMADGYTVTFYEIGGVRHATDSYEVQKNILLCLGAEFAEELPEKNYHIYVDAIFGVGLKREVVPCTTAEFPRPAPRPRNSALKKGVLNRLGYRTPNWRLALAEFVESEFCVKSES